MEYASGGELFERICNAGRFSEDEVCCLNLNTLFILEMFEYFVVVLLLVSFPN